MSRTILYWNWCTFFNKTKTGKFLEIYWPPLCTFFLHIITLRSKQFLRTPSYFMKFVTIALSILSTEPQRNCCSDFIVRSIVTSSKTILRYAKEMKSRRNQIEAICWVIQESNTKAPNPCNCFRICVRSSTVLLKGRLLHVRNKLPTVDLSAFSSVSQYRLVVTDCASQHEYWMQHACIHLPDNLSITLPADAHSDVYAILSIKKLSFVHTCLSEIWVRNSVTGLLFPPQLHPLCLRAQFAVLQL